jgi:hypothetical protein
MADLFSRIIPGRLNRRGIGVNSVTTAPFKGNFATLFPGAFQVVQTDLGLTYGGTPLANAGNTSTTVLTLSGTISGAYVPVLVKATNTNAIGSGAQFSISYDSGSTFAMTGVTPTAATPIALTGAGAGLLMAWSAGSGVANDRWQATCAGLADNSGNGKNYSQATASLQPVITIGLNGKPGLLFDGVDDYLASALAVSLPYKIWAVFRITASSGSQAIYFGPSAVSAGFFYSANGNPAIDVSQYNGGVVANASSATLNAWFRGMALFSNSAADFVKCGSLAPVTGTNSGPSIRVDAQIGAAFLGTQPSHMELLACAWIAGGANTSIADAATNTVFGYGIGAIAT